MAEAQQQAKPAQSQAVKNWVNATIVGEIAVITWLNHAVAGQYSAWKANATPEQKTADAEYSIRMASDPAFAGHYNANIWAMWTAADADNDGRLNLAEFKVYD